MRKTKEFTKEEQEAIIYNYVTLKKGLKDTARAVIGNTNDARIKKFLMQNEIPLHSRGGQYINRTVNNLSQETIEKIIYSYCSLNKGLKEVGKIVGHDYMTVRKILEQNNIPIKPSGGVNQRRYFLNESFFLEQSHDLGYILGMLGSDGCVAQNRNMIYIELQRQDREILEKINTVIKNDRPVKDYETGRGYENSKIYFYSKMVKDELATYNIIPNKTYESSYKFPDKLKKEFYPDYIRGLFDGDGSIKARTGYNVPIWQIDSSSKEIVKKIQEYLNEFNIKTTIHEIPKVNISIYRILCSNITGCKHIFNIMYYPNVNLYMKRKYDKYVSLLS